MAKDIKPIRNPMSFVGMARNTVLYVEDHLTEVTGNSLNNEPMRIHDPKFSFFKVGIITDKKNGKRTSASDIINVGGADGRFVQLISYSKYANYLDFRERFRQKSAPTEPAYERLAVGREKGKTAAEFVLSHTYEEAMAQIGFLEANAGRFRKNREDIEKLQSAVALHQAGRLDVSRAASAQDVVVYDSGQRTNVYRTNQNGSHPAHRLIVTWTLGEKYPVAIRIIEGDVFTKEGEVTGEMTNRRDTSISVTAAEWMKCIAYMERQEKAFWEQRYANARMKAEALAREMKAARDMSQNSYAQPSDMNVQPQMNYGMNYGQDWQNWQ